LEAGGLQDVEANWEQLPGAAWGVDEAEQEWAQPDKQFAGAIAEDELSLACEA